jgi:hypothetical protein
MAQILTTASWASAGLQGKIGTAVDPWEWFRMKTPVWLRRRGASVVSGRTEKGAVQATRLFSFQW